MLQSGESCMFLIMHTRSNPNLLNCVCLRDVKGIVVALKLLLKSPKVKFAPISRVFKESKNTKNPYSAEMAHGVKIKVPWIKCLFIVDEPLWNVWETHVKMLASWLVLVAFCVICFGLQLFASGLNRRAITAAVLETRTQAQLAWDCPAMVMKWASPASICECWCTSPRSAASSDAAASISESCARSFHWSCWRSVMRTESKNKIVEFDN